MRLRDHMADILWACLVARSIRGGPAVNAGCNVAVPREVPRDV